MLNFLNHILSLVVVFLDPDFLNFWFFPFIALSFLVTVPIIIRSLISWR